MCSCSHAMHAASGSSASYSHSELSESMILALTAALRIAPRDAKARRQTMVIAASYGRNLRFLTTRGHDLCDICPHGRHREGPMNLVSVDVGELWLIHFSNCHRLDGHCPP